MLWYGWTLTTILIAAALGIIAMLLPERVTRKIPLSLVWIFPILAIPYVDLFADAVVDARRQAMRTPRWCFPGSAWLL